MNAKRLKCDLEIYTFLMDSLISIKSKQNSVQKAKRNCEVKEHYLAPRLFTSQREITEYLLKLYSLTMIHYVSITKFG